MWIKKNRQFGSQPSYPSVLLNLNLERDSYDVNVTPNKRTLLIQNEGVLLTAIKVFFIYFTTTVLFFFIM